MSPQSTIFNPSRRAGMAFDEVEVELCKLLMQLMIRHAESSISSGVLR